MTPAELRARTMTVGMALKLAEMTARQVLEQSYRDAELMMRDMDAQRQRAEDRRSVHRNGNRLAVLVCGLLLSLFWPALALNVFHSIAAATWTSSIAFTGDMFVTAWALRRRY